MRNARFLLASTFGAVVAVVFHAHGCAPTGIDPQKPTIGPRLGESTAALPSNPSVPPPDAGGPREVHVPLDHPLTTPGTAQPSTTTPAQPANPSNPPTPAGTDGTTVTPEPVPSDPFPSP